MKCVYIAGKLSSPDPLRFLRNINRLQEWTARAREFGLAPFPVADDFADIMRTDGVTMEMVKEASMAWLRRSDCVFVTPDWESSQGTRDEIEEAVGLGIPVFYGLEDVLKWGAEETV